MSKTVKDTLLKQYNGGGRPSNSDLPPTKSTFLMRLKHTAHGVDYNFFEHAEDHFQDALNQLKILSKADPDKASELSQSICKRLDKWHKQAEEYING